MAPVRQTHLGTWVGKRYGYGDWLQGSWALGPRVHLRLAQEEAAGGAGLAPVSHLGSLPWPNTDHLSISRGTFLCPQPAPPTLTLRLVTFGSFLWIYTTMITAAIKARLGLRVTDAKSI